jgi:hypothetical protein
VHQSPRSFCAAKCPAKDSHGEGQQDRAEKKKYQNRSQDGVEPSSAEQSSAHAIERVGTWVKVGHELAEGLLFNLDTARSISG